MTDKKEIREKLQRRKQRRQKLVRLTAQFFVWTGIAVLYYLGFSLFFDTPVEYMLKPSNDKVGRTDTVVAPR